MRHCSIPAAFTSRRQNNRFIFEAHFILKSCLAVVRVSDRAASLENREKWPIARSDRSLR
jgi:hypothetical protein